MKQMRIPGLTIAIIQEGELAYSGGFGARNLERNLPMTENSLFGIGSITKSFTTLAIMQLVEQGKIDLHAPVNKYIDFRLGSKKNPITIHHALSHSSGLPDMMGSILTMARGAGFIDPIEPMSSRKDFLLHLNGAVKENLYEPGEKFLYNNDIFTLLGLIIERITDMEYQEYIKKNILQPLKMNKSFYTREELEQEDNRITGYISIKEDEPLKGIEHPFDYLIHAPGGLITTVIQMVNYMKALMNGGLFEGKQIIQKSSIEQMWGHHIEIPEDTSYKMGKKGWYGYGWMIENYFDHLLVQHGGGITGSPATCSMIPEKKLGVIIGANRETTPSLKLLASGILAILLGIDINDAIPIMKIQTIIKKLIGKYQIYNKFIPCEVYLKGGVLYIKVEIPIPGYPQIDAPLTVDNFDELKFHIPIVFPGLRISVQFFIDDKTGKVHLAADRYYWHKIE